MSRPGYRFPNYLTDEDKVRVTSAHNAMEELLEWLREIDEDGDADKGRATWIAHAVAALNVLGTGSVRRHLFYEIEARDYYDTITGRKR